MLCSDRPPRPSTSTKATSESGFLTGSGLNRSSFKTPKIAVFAPMPSASVSTATAVEPGFFSNWRKANLRSFIVRCQWSVVSRSSFDSALRIPHFAFESFVPQRFHWIDFGGAARGHEAGQERHRQQHERNHPERQRISGANAEQQISQ